ncbi:hypothetical protein J2849_005960 [Azospirillum melinis]|nr:hypothetical protein [Azospirillum melinis]
MAGPIDKTELTSHGPERDGGGALPIIVILDSGLYL